ncbi:MAG: SLBB domain-containing protein, partial [Gammaproteobacteria bacterium]|nr:SLBB domain-containing protein [Gammaproteobacteria bacterium]
MFRFQNHIARTLVVLFTLLFSVTAFSQISAKPSAAQIEMFKKLPKSQQQKIAKEMGVDLHSMLDRNTTEQKNTDGNTKKQPEYHYLDQMPVSELSLKEQDDNEPAKLKPFGLEFFEQNQDAFLPNGSIPIPADYVVGPGDSINISLFGKESSQFTSVVNNEGALLIPGLEPLIVAGLTYSELKDYIEQTVKNKMIGIKSAVSISNLGGIQVYVIGAVKKPGAYHLSSLSTVTNALFISGGPNEVGSFRKIEVKRAGKTVANIDLYDLFIFGDVSNDIRLQQGDVVFIDSIGKQASIDGKVRRPAIYELLGSESVTDLIDMAGGLDIEAYPNHVLLSRFSDSFQRTLKKLNLRDEASLKSKLENGDYITVLPASQVVEDAVYVAGSVARPTTYAWVQGLVLSDLISNKSDLLTNTDLNYALVLTRDTLDQYVVNQFSPKELLSGNSISLNPGDLVLFFNRFDNSIYEFEEIDSIGFEFEEIDSIGSEFAAMSGFDTKYNYLYSLQTGSFTEKQKALLDTKELSRDELLKPINKILAETTRAGKFSPLIQVTGQVKFPGTYPLPQKASLREALAAAGGLTESANLMKGEVSRSYYLEDGSVSTKHMPLDLVQSFTLKKDSSLVLKPRDVVNIFQKPNWNDELTVTLRGEVKYPGAYTVDEGEDLASVISRAGGLTEFASLESAFFTRKALRALEVKQARDMAKALSKELALKSISS